MTFLLSILLFAVVHSLVWFGTNLQFVENTSKNYTLMVCVILAIPTSLAGYYASKYAYETFNSAWSVKLCGFGVGYIIFPILTWILLKESPLTLKTCLCILLSMTIIAIQVFVPDN